MAQGEVMRAFTRPPFANYDIVVYFGCGLFVLPFARHYVLEPFGLRFPKFDIQLDVPFAGEFVSALTLLFTVYIGGHIIAYVSSQLIERSSDTFLGKTS